MCMNEWFEPMSSSGLNSLCWNEASSIGRILCGVLVGENQDNHVMLSGRHDVTDIMLKTALSSNQLTNQLLQCHHGNISSYIQT